jgi:hypothetical protein
VTLTVSKLAYVYFENEPGRRSAAKLPPQTNKAANRAALSLNTGRR